MTASFWPKYSTPTQVSTRTSGWVRSALPVGELLGDCRQSPASQRVRALTGPQAPRLEGALNAVPHLLRDLLAAGGPGAGPGLLGCCDD